MQPRAAVAAHPQTRETVVIDHHLVFVTQLDHHDIRRDGLAGGWGETITGARIQPAEIVQMTAQLGRQQIEVTGNLLVAARLQEVKVIPDDHRGG